MSRYVKCDQCGRRVETEKSWVRYSAVEDGKRRYHIHFCSDECGAAYELTHPRFARADSERP